MTIYLDYNASAPVLEEALEATTEALRECGNPSSVHARGRAARGYVEQARREIAELLGVNPSNVIFTSGATEANVLALRVSGRSRIFASAIEHASILQAVPESHQFPVTPGGTVDCLGAAALLGNDCRDTIVSVMAANNETGVIQPVQEIAAIAHERGAFVHCDAVQAVGRIDCDMKHMGVDMLSLSAHKIGGPKGAGALILADDMQLEPLLRGGGQERGQRAGTENIAGIAGFGAAAHWVRTHRSKMENTRCLVARLENRINDISSGVKIFGSDMPRLPNTSCFAISSLDAETQVIGLDLADIAVSSGAACSSGKIADSHVLRAMGVGRELSANAIRVSFGPANTEADVDQFIKAWGDLCHASGAPGHENVGT